jgi:hypothetical protein
VVHDDAREQGYGNGRATPEGVIVVAAFVMVVLMSVTCAAVAVAVAVVVVVAVVLRVVGVVHLLDALSE